MEVDLYRAHFCAVATKRRCITEMFPFFHVTHIGCDHCTDRSAVCCCVCVAAYVLVNRTSIQACAAAYTVKTFALLFIVQNIGASVVEQDNVHFIWTVCFTRLFRTADHGIVHGYRLARSVCCKQWPEQPQVS